MAGVKISCPQCGDLKAIKNDPKTKKPITFMLSRYDEALKRPLNRGQKLRALICQKCGYVSLFDVEKFSKLLTHKD